MNRQGLFTRAVTALTGVSLLASCGLWPGMGVKPTAGAPEPAAPSTAPPPEWITLNQPVIREKMDYSKPWGPNRNPGGLEKPTKNIYKLKNSNPMTTQVLSWWDSTHPRTIRVVDWVQYPDVSTGWFWPSLEQLPGCIPKVLMASYSYNLELDENAQNIRGGITEFFNDVDEWRYSVNQYRQEGLAGPGSRIRVGLDGGQVLRPGANQFTIYGSIEPYECYSSCCARQPAIFTSVDVYYDLPDPSTLPTPGPGGSGDPNGSPDPNASPSDGSGGGSGSPGPGGSGDPNGSPSPGSSGDPNGGGDGDGTGGTPGSGSPSPSTSPGTGSPSPSPSSSGSPGSGGPGDGDGSGPGGPGGDGGTGGAGGNSSPTPKPIASPTPTPQPSATATPEPTPTPDNIPPDIQQAYYSVTETFSPEAGYSGKLFKVSVQVGVSDRGGSKLDEDSIDVSIAGALTQEVEFSSGLTSYSAIVDDKAFDQSKRLDYHIQAFDNAGNFTSYYGKVNAIGCKVGTANYILFANKEKGNADCGGSMPTSFGGNGGPLKLTDLFYNPVLGRYIGQTYSSFRNFKNTNPQGGAGAGNAWHHIVEKFSSNIQNFGPRTINNSHNLVKIPNRVHDVITARYNRNFELPNGTVVRYRDYVATKSYEEQYLIGVKVLNEALAKHGLPHFVIPFVP